MADQVSAPPAPTASAPPPSPAPAPVKTVSLPDTSFNDDIDALAGRTPEPKKPARPPAEPKPKPEVKPESKEKPKPDAPEKKEPAPEEDDDGYEVKLETLKPEKKEPEKKEGEAHPKGEAPAELRNAYESLKKRTAELESELTHLKSKPADDPEKKKLTELLTAREKRLAELEEEMKYVNYEKSTEYLEKYDQPVVAAYKAGQAKAASMEVSDPETGDIRKGTPEDFALIMSARSDAEAAKLARDLFGDSAPVVLFHKERVEELNQKRIDAVEQFRKTAKDRDEKIQAEEVGKREAQMKEHQERAELFLKARDEAAEKYPHLFKTAEGDDKGNELLEKGYARVDLVFGKANKDKPLTREQTIKLHAMIRNKAGAFDRLNYLHKKANSRIAELEKQLAEYQKSGPDGGQSRGERRDGGIPSFEEEIDAIAAASPIR